MNSFSDQLRIHWYINIPKDCSMTLNIMMRNVNKGRKNYGQIGIWRRKLINKCTAFFSSYFYKTELFVWLVYMVWTHYCCSIKLWKPFFSTFTCWRMKIWRTGALFPFFPVYSIWRQNLISWCAVVFTSNSDKNKVWDMKCIWYENWFTDL